jgi:predicted transcriptional regulator
MVYDMLQDVTSRRDGDGEDEAMGKRFNIQLDDEHTEKLEALAARTHVQPGTLARSLLSVAIDQADPEALTIVEVLDAIPGAFERHEQGLADVHAGRTTPLEDL